MGDLTKQAVVLVLAVVVLAAPLFGQIAGVMWWLRRAVRTSKKQSHSWIDLQGEALLFNVVCTTSEALLLWLLFWSTAATRNYLGYVGFALEGLVMVYAGGSLIAGIILASSLYWVEKSARIEDSKAKPEA